MKIFITGSNGFIGSHIVRSALNKGYNVLGLRLPKHKEKIHLAIQPTWISGSLEDDHRRMLEGCDALIHMAAYGVNPQKTSWEESFRWNVTASLRLWHHASQVGVKRIIIAGSCSEYGKSAERYEYVPVSAPLEPIDAYGASKAAATLAATTYARENNLELAVLRPFHVYGEGEGEGRFWPAIRKATLEGKDFSMTLGEQIRDFTPVEFVADSFLNYAMQEDLLPGQPLIKNIGLGNPQSLLNFAEKIWQKSNAKGMLLPGNVEYRKNEIMRYVPEL